MTTTPLIKVYILPTALPTVTKLLLIINLDVNSENLTRYSNLRHESSNSTDRNTTYIRSQLLFGRNEIIFNQNENINFTTPQPEVTSHYETTEIEHFTTTFSAITSFFTTIEQNITQTNIQTNTQTYAQTNSTVQELSTSDFSTITSIVIRQELSRKVKKVINVDFNLKKAIFISKLRNNSYFKGVEGATFYSRLEH